ncbi:hypothetical protein [Vibrio vulnificus]|nr:hypothetical protein [Vibrio vulnificus]NHE87952.1 hypothetical protein [Vibrio vulnificus]
MKNQASSMITGIVKGDVNGKPMASSEDKEYTAKSGEDYVLSYCYSI